MTMLFDHAINPCPADAQSCIITTEDGYRLRTASWQPKGQCLGTILMLQGRAEFIEKYFETITRFLELGFAVISFDWRGQGGSDRLLPDRMKGHIHRFEDYQKDLQAVQIHYADLLRQPVLMFAHSMGGMVLLQKLQRQPRLAKAVVITSPMLDIQLLRQQVWLKQLISACCLLGFKKQYPPLHRSQSPFTMKFENNPLTRNQSRFERNQLILKNRPELAVGMPTLGWLQEAVNAMQKLPDMIAGLTQHTLSKVLIVAPMQDRVTASDATREFCMQLDQIKFIEIDGIEHEVLMEADIARQQFWQSFEQHVLPLFQP
jgi:lysophospholipase